jgi:hypothetical protein
VPRAVKFDIRGMQAAHDIGNFDRLETL